MMEIYAGGGERQEIVDWQLLILFFHDGVANWHMYILAHLLLIAFIIFVIPCMHRSKNQYIRLLRWWYPILLFTGNYKEINAFTHILHSDWKDNLVLEFEKYLFGTHPTLWLERIVSPVMTEIMKFDYFTYYLMIITGALILYKSSKRHKFIRYLSTVCIAFYISYIGFILFPVRGPRYTLYDKYTKDYEVVIQDYYGPYVDEDVRYQRTRALKGYMFTNFQDYIMRYGSLHGGCMPSSHIAVAFVCMIMMLIYGKKIFYVYLPLVTLLCVSVVYNRYHYISDVAGGIIVALIALWITPRWLSIWSRLKKN